MARLPSSDTIQQDKAAVLVYLRMKHKDPIKGFVLCGVVGVSKHFPFLLGTVLTIPCIFFLGHHSRGTSTLTHHTAGWLTCTYIDPFRTVCHNVLVGSVSFASPGAKALHNASTAQEITVISPSAANFEFRVRILFFFSLLPCIHLGSFLFIFLALARSLTNAS